MIPDELLAQVRATAKQRNVDSDAILLSAREQYLEADAETRLASKSFDSLVRATLVAIQKSWQAIELALQTSSSHLGSSRNSVHIYYRMNKFEIGLPTIRHGAQEPLAHL